MGVSLKPSDAIEGGGLLDDADVKVKKSLITLFDYQGKANPVPALMWELKVPGQEELVTQYWSFGKADDWMPSEDGKSLCAVGKATQLINSSNGMMLLNSCVEAGFPENQIGEDATVFEGLECHMMRSAVKRKGINADKETTVLLVSKIITMPGEAAKTTTKGKGKGSGKGGKGGSKGGSKGGAAAANTDVEAEATEFIMGLLTEAPDGVEKNKLAKAAFDNIPKDNPNRPAIIQLVYKDTFLTAGPWNYADGKITL